MTCATKGLSWAALIIAAAILAKQNGVSDTSAMLMIGAMLSVFIASRPGRAGCGGYAR